MSFSGKFYFLKVKTKGFSKIGARTLGKAPARTGRKGHNFAKDMLQYLRNTVFLPVL